MLANILATDGTNGLHVHIIDRTMFASFDSID